MAISTPGGALGAVASALVLATVLGCSDGTDQAVELAAGPDLRFAATTGYLRAAIDDSTDETFRFESRVTLRRPSAGTVELPVASGIVDHQRSQVRVDLGVAVDALSPDVGTLPAGVTPDDLFVEVVTDPHTLYMRGPFYRVAADDLPGQIAPGSPADVFRALSEGWIAVDAAGLGSVLPADAAGRFTGNRNLDPTAFLDLVRSAEAVGELGRRRIDGVTVEGLAAEVDYVAVLSSQGLGGPLPSASPTAPPADAGGDSGDAGEGDDQAARTVPVEVWIDDDDLVRQVKLDIDMRAYVDAFAAAGDLSAPLTGLRDLGLTTTIDFRDYGDDELEVAIPVRVTEMTDAFVQLHRSGGRVGAGVGTLVHDLASFDQMWGGELTGADLDALLTDDALLAGSDALLGGSEELAAEAEALAAETEALLAESDALLAEIEAQRAESDAALAESEAVLAESEELLESYEPPPMPDIPPPPPAPLPPPPTSIPG